MRIVAGKYRGKALASPSDQSIRPTSDRARESIFNILGSRLGPVFEGKRVLDLFAGTGALGLEALSRGAAHVTFVDIGAEARGIIRDHIQAFGVAGITKLLRRDATGLGAPGTFGQFDLIFLDPPYHQGLGEKALVELAGNGWIAPGAIVVWEEAADADVIIPAGFALDDTREYGAAAVRFLSFSG
ncbi:16S rRNA (guanine(966)-N(2))-methyltransferase RsmD [Devosia faecipullorum]|uniref:16S rRNA (guanine(966)-N(2))-methyltransferase RsmD n=1 Tax=Devosia faecipullorum TaxID=2755039 RepID=UPI00187BAAD3|nr:16S rRNA (guanine(966)-N(2))-methyltransferase RsmD [Devosia faecipullorum]MBE7733913.1 16S rRNA (guanine(966)-N(2))-methyltransferase RsmD [Devosia faecipullorum]